MIRGSLGLLSPMMSPSSIAPFLFLVGAPVALSRFNCIKVDNIPPPRIHTEYRNIIATFHPICHYFWALFLWYTLLTCVHMEDVAQTLSVASSMALRLSSGWA